MPAEQSSIDWGSGSTLGQGNCSVVFFHDEKWWGCLRRGPFSPLDWKFSRYDTSPGPANERWKELQIVHLSKNDENPDCIVDSANDRVYIFGQGGSDNCRITSLTYDKPSETWTKDPLVDEVEIPGINGSSGADYEDKATMVLAQTGRIFVFDANETTSPDLLVNWSDDNGATWLSPDVVTPFPDQATSIRDQDDAPAFDGGGSAIDAVQFIWDDGVLGPRNYIGVLWGEGDGSGHRFLRILESADPSVKGNWFFEDLGVLPFGENSEGRVAITRDSSFVNNRLYAIVVTQEETDFNSKHYCFVRDNKTDAPWTAFECEMTGLNPNPSAILKLVGIQYNFSQDQIHVFCANSEGSFPENDNDIYTRIAPVLVDTSDDVSLTFGSVSSHMLGGDQNLTSFGMRHEPVDSVSGLMIVSRSKGQSAALFYGFLEISGAPIPPRPPPILPTADALLRLKIFPGFNDPIQLQHGDDQIRDGTALAGVVHENPAIVIGNAIESYAGAKTIEIFRETIDLDTDDDPVVVGGVPQGDGLVLVQAEQLIELAKFITLPDINITGSPFVDSTFFHYRIRLRSEVGSTTFIDVDQYAYVVVHQDDGEQGA